MEPVGRALPKSRHRCWVNHAIDNHSRLQQVRILRAGGSSLIA